MKTSSIALLACVKALFIAGCAAPPPLASAAPADFSLEISVIAPEDSAALDSADDAAGPPAHARTSRYVLLPGGDFHATTDPQQSAAHGGVPPFVRTLSQPEIDALWKVTRPQLANEAGETATVDDSAPLPANAASPVQYDVWVFATDQRASARTIMSQESDLPPALRDLVRSLAALAWVSDDPPALHVVAPRRYDFGPDPYARYRSPD